MPWEKKLSRSTARLWHAWAKPILVVVLLLSSFRSAVADWNDVPTGSMKPSILEGDRIFINKLAYDLKVPFTTWRLAAWGDPQRGEIIVFYSPADETRYVKRVVAVPGDRIALKDNRLFVNGEPATYTPLDPAIGAQLPAGERRQHQLAREEVEGHAHPVMFSADGPRLDQFGPVTIPPGQYFVMGDNRDNSFDSRWFGFVERRRILGRAVAVAVSLDPANGYQPRWQRFFSGLP
jgi:signal peptidase I